MTTENNDMSLEIPYTLLVEVLAGREKLLQVKSGMDPTDVLELERVEMMAMPSAFDGYVERTVAPVTSEAHAGLMR